MPRLTFALVTTLYGLAGTRFLTNLGESGWEVFNVIVESGMDRGELNTYRLFAKQPCD